MSDTPQPEAPKIEFIDAHLPSLKAGNYHVEVKQDVTVKGTSIQPFTGAYTFSIGGERYSIQPKEIVALYPPPRSDGHHSYVLPHVVIGRSTLPWERDPSAYSEDHSGHPWLMLLVFHADEAPEVKSIDVKTLYAGEAGIRFPERDREIDEHDDDPVTVIDVPVDLLKQIAPNWDDLPLLAHVRQWEKADGTNAGKQQAVILGNRLPLEGGRTVVHLVSVEGHFDSSNKEWIIAEGDTAVRLVSLLHWQFQCVADGRSFAEIIETLDVGMLRLPGTSDDASTLDELVSPLSGAEEYRARGKVLLPQHLRNGSQSVGAYHGPLSVRYERALPAPLPIKLPARSADDLLIYDERFDIYDVSYAAAWELGRMLALHDTEFALGLYHWKRSHRQQQKLEESDLLHLPETGLGVSPDLPPKVGQWLLDRALLVDIPFEYLVPDERLLPPESIRFFSVDLMWTACLLDGAFTVGRVSTGDHERDVVHYDDQSSLHARVDSSTKANGSASNDPVPMTGFLLRSELVSAWPQLEVEAWYEDNSDRSSEAFKPLRRMARLSPNVLLCMFEGTANCVYIHAKPEGLHSGVNPPDPESSVEVMQTAPTKYPRSVREGEIGKEDKENPVEVPFRGDVAQQVLDIRALADTLLEAAGSEPSSRANFALQMIEGVPRGRFFVKAASSIKPPTSR